MNLISMIATKASSELRLAQAYRLLGIAQAELREAQAQRSARIAQAQALQMLPPSAAIEAHIFGVMNAVEGLDIDLARAQRKVAEYEREVAEETARYNRAYGMVADALESTHAVNA